jgi:hypothetical protein
VALACLGWHLCDTVFSQGSAGVAPPLDRPSAPVKGHLEPRNIILRGVAPLELPLEPTHMQGAWELPWGVLGRSRPVCTGHRPDDRQRPHDHLTHGE